MSKWRAVHPAADAFPMMLEDELAKLTEDIKANGMRFPITSTTEVCSGGNRLEVECRSRSSIRADSDLPWR
jgi:hypothetical protein